VKRPRVVLLDIEGTTTPISFVYDQLFPYALRKLEAFFGSSAHRDRDDDLVQLRLERRAEGEDAQLPGWSERSDAEANASAVALLRWLMSRDRKSTGLKSVQGKIWEVGYRQGELAGLVYPDVAPALARWRRDGRRVAIFSSGSALAQELLFRHSTAGDLTGHLSGYFDTGVGPKREPESYRRIAGALRVSPSEVLFVSDVIQELDAAAEAGMRTALSVRATPQLRSNHRAIQSFDELD